MKRTVYIALVFAAAQVHAKELVCFTVSSITLSNMGQTIEHEVTSPDDLTSPEAYTIFDLAAGTTTLFWLDTDGSKVKEISALKRFNRLLYVGEYEVGSEKHYTTYHFEKDFQDGLLVEAHFVASFRCEQITMQAAEERYSIPFSDFKSAD